MAEHQERIGEQIGDYRLLRWLGGGGFGNVYLAQHTRDRSQVAVKVLQIRLTHPDDFRSFLNEARMIRLRHPHIMPLLDFGLSRQDEPFLVMEYASSSTLRDRHPKGSRVPLSPIVSYATQIASALHYAHTHHLVHRDVKPENMLLRADDVLLLSDFGIATTAQSTHSASTSIGIGGTMPYMAPEQLSGHPKAASDQYALAIVIYEWLTGRCPFVGTAVEVMSQHMMQPPPPLRHQVAGLPEAVEQVVFKALAKDPRERFASIEQFAQALQAAIPSPPMPTPQNTPIPSPPLSITLRPSTPILAPQSSTVLPTHAGLPVETFSTRQGSQPHPSISNTQSEAATRAVSSSMQTPHLQDSSPQQQETLSPSPDVWQRRFLSPNTFMTAQQETSATIPSLPHEGMSGLLPIPRGLISLSFLRKAAPFVIAVFLFIISGLGVFQAVSSYKANALATAAAVDFNATASAQADATATTSQQIYAQATSGTPTFTDPLSDNRNGWATFNASWGACGFTDGAYHFTLANGGFWNFCNCPSTQNLKNFALQVQVNIVKGNDGGLVFGSPDSYYRIYIDSRGTYTLLQYTNSDNQTQTLRSSSSPAINTGLNQTNVMTVMVNNSNFSFYVNDQFVVSASLSVYSQGAVSFTAQSVDQATDVVFSNLKVWTL